MDEMQGRIFPRELQIFNCDLPDGALAHVASYLPEISKSVLAVALAAPSKSWCEFEWDAQLPPVTYKKVISSSEGQWEELDFAGIEESLASKLTDDDLKAILLCIDAKKILRKLKLGSLVNIIGQGLEPLQNSIVLEQIDLGIVHEGVEPKISQEPILPILASIVQQDCSSLKYIRLPKKWCEWWDWCDGRNSELTRFLTDFNQLLESRLFNCAGCRGLYPHCPKINDDDQIGYGRNYGKQYGIQNFTCYSCLRNFCHNKGLYLCYGNGCDRGYCANCYDINRACHDCVEVPFMRDAWGSDLQGLMYLCLYRLNGKEETV
ncbi:hypothetical protein ACHAXR_001395, partial [Thalassiosira sp. AJA248-18]